jgi:hypothetical protein
MAAGDAAALAGARIARAGAVAAPGGWLKMDGEVPGPRRVARAIRGAY